MMVMRRMITWRGRRPNGLTEHFGTHRMGFVQAHKDGKAVLLEESSWRNICGFYANVGGGYLVVQFRRFWR